MANYNELPPVDTNEPTKTSWANNVRNNGINHEDRIGQNEADIELLQQPDAVREAVKNRHDFVGGHEASLYKVIGGWSGNYNTTLDYFDVGSVTNPNRIVEFSNNSYIKIHTERNETGKGVSWITMVPKRVALIFDTDTGLWVAQFYGDLSYGGVESRGYSAEDHATTSSFGTNPSLNESWATYTPPFTENKYNFPLFRVVQNNDYEIARAWNDMEPRSAQLLSQLQVGGDGVARVNLSVVLYTRNDYSRAIISVNLNTTVVR